MVFVAGGTFTMGCTSEQGSDCRDVEKPSHSVSLSSFSIGKYEVTQAQFAAFIEATGYRTDAEKEGWSYVWTGSEWEKANGVTWRNNTSGNGVQPSTHPIIHVSWNDAIAFCNWLSEVTGKSYRLPTEAEWEYAARGGNNSQGYKYSGSDSLGSVGWYNENSGSSTHAVGKKSPNELGLYDMSGNVWEWCSDWYGANYYSGSPSSNPRGPSSGSYRVLRGGSWYYYATHCRVAYRYNYTPDFRNDYYGFRLVLSQ
jgi:formylglycine-generating enzyme required for sulfatase activity